MGNCEAESADELNSYIIDQLTLAAEKHNVKLRGQSNSTRLEFLITDIAQEGQLVILLDEYDKPLINTLTTPEAEACRKVLRGFYSSIKKCDGNERFVFVTGASKFCHVSMFSGFNNPTDISTDYNYATMFGYTQKELEHYFAEHIDRACKQLNMPREELLSEIKAWYDGYKFHANGESVYNPVSLAEFFIHNAEFNNYWFSTGTPTFLMELVKKKHFCFENMLSSPVPSVAFEAFEIDDIDPVTLLLQTGYLTIKSMVRQYNMPWYWLDFPNLEVNQSFNTFILNAYMKKSKRETVNFCKLLTDSMANGNMAQLRRSLEAFFAGITYDIHHKDHSNFQNIFFAVFHMLGVYIKSEQRTSDGRIDAVCETEKFVYIFEFKLNDDDTALEQIKAKEYFKQYLVSNKRIMIIGVNFNTDSGKIADWKDEEILVR